MKFASLFGLVLLTSVAACAKPVKIRVRVCDENGEPVAGADVSCGVTQSLAPGHGWGAGRVRRNVAQTDKAGICEIGNDSPDGFAAVAVQKDGYHGCSGVLLHFVEGSIMRWHPWCPDLEIVIHRIRTPIALHVREVDLPFPDNGDSVGYDLLKGDWVRPYGEGLESDFVFRRESLSAGEEVLDALLIGFSREEDGFCPVQYPSPPPWVFRWRDMVLPEAPLTGYRTKALLAVEEQRTYPDNTPFHCPNLYGVYFRIRTMLAPDGELREALYGKIYKGFELHWYRGIPHVRFSYYLNPSPNSRNLDFNQQDDYRGTPARELRRRFRP